MLRQLSKLCMQRVTNAARRPVIQSDVQLLPATADIAAANAISHAYCWKAVAPLAVMGICSTYGHRFNSSAAHSGYVALNTLRDNPGAVRKGRRLGRGIGSSKGKTAGRGHKGQKSRAGRSPRLGFEGGQTPMRFRVPKKGFHNPFSLLWEKVELRRVAQWINDGKLDTERVITMRHLRDSGAVMKRVNKCNGIKLMGTGGAKLQSAVHLQVSQATAQARAAVEAAGGSVTTVYYNKLGLRALLDPEWFKKKGRLLPNPARPPPKMQTRFDVVGSLPPQTTIAEASRMGPQA